MLDFFKKNRLDDLTALRGSIQVKRIEIQIAVIDDKIFPPIEELRRHEFNITFFNDVESINLLSDFDIVITDIKGVGKYYDTPQNLDS
jgi:hypothetical protein